jgi:putative nucleotidyltransferase with HDIG domain
MKINNRHLILVLCGILLFMLAADFLKIDGRLDSLAAAAVIVLLVLRTDFISGFFMSVLFSFAYYSLHPGISMPALFLNMAVFTTLAFLAHKLAPEKRNEKSTPASDDSEKEFVRKVTGSLMLAHEMMCEIKKGMPHDGLLKLMAKNIFSLLNVKQVMVYTAGQKDSYNLVLSEGAFERGAIKNPVEFKNMERLSVKNVRAGALRLIRGADEGFYLVIPSGDGETQLDAVLLFREKEFDNSEIYITEFFIAQVYAVIDKHRYSDSLRDNYEKVIETLSLAIDAKDQDTSWHSLDTMRYAGKIADRLGLSGGEKEKIKYASLLHDIGKINISSSILNKPGSLTEAEYDVIKMHPEEGAGILKKLDIFSGIMSIILHHHEHIDGQGYPKSLKGEDIPIGARICAIADAYSVMITDRPYRKAMTKEEALKELKRCAGTQFDAKLVETFLEILKEEKEEPDARFRGSVN